MTDKVLTANRLSDGIAVWLDAAGHWTENLQDALVARHAEAAASLEAIGKRDFADNKVVDVAVIDVEETNGVLWPTRLRERPRRRPHNELRERLRQSRRSLHRSLTLRVPGHTCIVTMNSTTPLFRAAWNSFAIRSSAVFPANSQRTRSSRCA